MSEPTVDICGIPCEHREDAQHTLYVGCVSLPLKGGGGVEIEVVVTDQPAALPHQRQVWVSLFLCRMPESDFTTAPSLDILHVIEGVTLEEIAERAHAGQVVDRAVEAWRLVFPEMQFLCYRPFSLTHTRRVLPTDSASNGIVSSGSDDG